MRNLICFCIFLFSLNAFAADWNKGSLGRSLEAGKKVSLVITEDPGVVFWANEKGKTFCQGLITLFLQENHSDNMFFSKGLKIDLTTLISDDSSYVYTAMTEEDSHFNHIFLLGNAMAMHLSELNSICDDRITFIAE